jgi:hypothetical protein
VLVLSRYKNWQKRNLECKMRVLDTAGTDKIEIKVQPNKASKYNHFFEQNGLILAYYAYNNSFTEVIPEKYKIIKAILNKISSITKTKETQQEVWKQ